MGQKSRVEPDNVERDLNPGLLLEQVLWVDQYGGLKTMRHDLSMDRGISFEAACAKLEHEAVAGDQSGWRRSRRPMFGHVMYLLALQKRAAKNLFVICRPNTGVSYFEMDVCHPVSSLVSRRWSCP